MILRFTFALFVIIVLTQPCFTQSISDIQKKSPSYTAINNSVQQGYLSLFEGNTFNKNQSITREEMAVVIDKLLQDVEARNFELNPTEVKELVHLASSFKNYLADHEANDLLIKRSINDLQKQYVTLNHDLSTLYEKQGLIKESLTESLTHRVKKDSADQQFYIWAGIISAGLAGILL